VQCLRNRLRGNNWGASDGQKTSRWAQQSRWGCSGDKFVVSKAGQMYDAPESEPNRKSQIMRTESASRGSNPPDRVPDSLQYQRIIGTWWESQGK
jgi:hypothetical protein